MLDLLSKVFGPHRAVSFYVFVSRWGLHILAGIAFIIGVSVLILLTGPERHEHVSFLTADVVMVVPLNKTAKNGVMAELRLPDGEEIRVTTTEAEVAATVNDTACVEKRRYVKSGDFRYRIKLPQYCSAE